MQQNSVVLNAIISEDCKLGPWARVEGAPFSDNAQFSIAILGVFNVPPRSRGSGAR